MKLYRIAAVMKRHIVQMFKDLARIFDMFYWPAVDIILWGYSVVWYGDAQTSTALLAALVLWGVVFRSQVDISLSFLEELWSTNVVNLFSTPLQLSEWVTAMMCLGLVRAFIVFLYSSIVIWLFFSANILTIGSMLISYFLLLMVSGWCIGFLTASFLVYYGKRVQAFVWAICWLFAIFGATLYPLSALPAWIQSICKIFPLSYIFEALRMQLATGYCSYQNLLIACVLNIFYLYLSIYFFNYMFNKSRTYGLAHLETD